jgi:hypothetical protein
VGEKDTPGLALANSRLDVYDWEESVLSQNQPGGGIRRQVH